MRVRWVEILHHFSHLAMRNFYNVFRGYDSDISEDKTLAVDRSNENGKDTVVKNSGSEISVVKNTLHT